MNNKVNSMNDCKYEEGTKFSWLLNCFYTINSSSCIVKYKAIWISYFLKKCKYVFVEISSGTERILHVREILRRKYFLNFLSDKLQGFFAFYHKYRN